jgi:glycosyltransferase involved in cell wall biosynthesis
MVDPVADRPAPLVSVVMPTFRQAAFVGRAVQGLLAQTDERWELVIVDDGSPDDTAGAVAPFLADPRLRYLRFGRNRGLGRALNVGVQAARAPLIAYLPSDDVWYADHLASLLAALADQPGAVMAVAGVRHHYNRYAERQVPGEPVQLVQVLHRRTPDRWLERDDLTTDDLDRMLWGRLRQRGTVAWTDRITCEWVAHPAQRHKLLREPEGGINPYRQWCGVREPLRVHTTTGNLIDEPRRFARFRDRPAAPPAADGLKILLVGELAYNADRVLALAERGHRLYGLWMERPHWYNSVGPLPFGHVADVPRGRWREEVRRIRPDVVYALLNWQAVPFARAVLADNPGIPFVWHFKEGPFISLEKGHWDDLVALHRGADGQIFSSEEMRDWYATVLPGILDGGPTLVLDGDLPKRDWFDGPRSPLRSDRDGEIHTVVPGRPIGLHPETVAELAAEGVHLHFYGDFTQGQWVTWIERTRGLAPRHLHLHPNADQDRWVAEFSQYDAGWLHGFASRNGGDLRRADWDDLNLPARMATLAVAGVPMLQRDNAGARVATQSLARDRGLGLFYRDIPDLAAQLRDRARLAAVRDNVWAQRADFTFDAHADRLVAFFREVIAARSGRRGAPAPTPLAAD